MFGNSIVKIINSTCAYLIRIRQEHHRTLWHGGQRSDKGEKLFPKEIGFFNPSSIVKKYLSDSVLVH